MFVFLKNNKHVLGFWSRGCIIQGKTLKKRRLGTEIWTVLRKRRYTGTTAQEVGDSSGCGDYLLALLVFSSTQGVFLGGFYVIKS